MNHAVILAGGSGSRLWPASRKAMPKQFLSLGARADESLLAATARRLAQPSDQVAVVTARSQAPQVATDLPHLAAEAIIAEPEGRNTAAALGYAAVCLLDRDPDAVMGAIPADQHINDEAGFADVVVNAFSIAAAHDVIVTIGIVPTRPETGFGYVQVGAEFNQGAVVVDRFVEKPDAPTAQQYMDSGDYLWNGGMFFVKAQVLLDKIERHMPETFAGLVRIREALATGDAATVDTVYAKLPRVSIDYGVMEQTDNVVCLRGDFGWDDVGSWSSVENYREADAHGNIVDGTVIASNASGNIVFGDDDHVVAIVGVQDLVVVQSGNAVLVVPKDQAQNVREVVEQLKQRDLNKYL